MKRVLLFVALFVALNVFGAVGLVSAHHPVVVGTAHCADSDGDFLVDWVVSADAVRGLTWTVGDITQPDSESFYFVSPYNVADGAPTFSVTAVWSNGVTGTLSGTVAVPETCPLPSTSTTEASQATTTVETGIPPTLPATGPRTTTTIVVWALALLVIGFLLVGRNGPRPRF